MPKALLQAVALDLFETAPCGYLFTERDGKITRANTTFLALTGYSSSDLVDVKRFQELLSGPAKIFYETHYAPLLMMQGFVNEVTVDLICADGRTLPVLVNSRILSEALDGTSQICSAIFDIRERRRYERELLAERRTAERLSDVVEFASDAIITVDRDLAICSWNRSAHLLFGYTSQEAKGANFRDLIVHRDALPEFERALPRLHVGEPVSYETKAIDKAGAPLDVSVTLTPTIDPPDEYMGFSAIIRDVRTRRRAEAAQKSIHDLELVNRLAHEINNPLQTIVNCLTILSAGENAKYADLAQQEARRVAAVVLDLLRLTIVPKGESSGAAGESSA